jgi:heat shock protein HslJ
MKKAIWILSAILLAAVLAGCGGQSGKLENTNWKLTTLGKQEALAEATPKLGFGSDGQLAGSTGCNQFSGTYTISGKTLSIKTGPMTMMACDEAVMKQEQDFLVALAATSTYIVDNNKLTLVGESDKELATFILLSPAALANTQWVATMYNNGKEAVVNVLPVSGITALFQSGGILTGFGGCNNYNTTYVAKGNTIVIKMPASTMMACPQEIMDQEQAYFTALQNADTYSLGADSLELRSDDGALQVQFKVVE